MTEATALVCLLLAMALLRERCITSLELVHP